MASLTKELSKSVSGVASAINASIQGTANTVVALSNTTVATVDSLGLTVNNLCKVSNEYSEDLVRDAKTASAENEIKRSIRMKALEQVAKDKEVMQKAVDATAKSLIADLLEDLD